MSAFEDTLNSTSISTDLYQDILFGKTQTRTPESINYTGQRVLTYIKFVRLSYLLLQQRKYLSRQSVKYSFISSKAVIDAKEIVSILNRNRSTTGVYTNASLFQNREVQRWFNEKNKVKIYFLPTFKEDETTNIGCATMFFEILQNDGIISITNTKYTTKVDGKDQDQDKLVVKLVENAKHKWLYLIGDGLTHVRLKSFVDTINDILYSFEDDYEM